MRFLLFAAITILSSSAGTKLNIFENRGILYTKAPLSNFIFTGSPLQQAKVLLRDIKKGGRVSRDSTVILSPLKELIGDTVRLSVDSFKAYLKKQNISLTELGISSKLIFNKVDTISKVYADYFVIHDVSTPNYGNKPFPSNINEIGRAWNNLGRWNENVTHVFVNRVGQSKTITDFSDTMQATKFEKKILGGKGAGRFIHVELIRPRKNGTNTEIKGSLAPLEGFRDAQYQRLALLYIFAGIRKGTWLIPAFYACIDDGIRNAHDDPQHFSLLKWNIALTKLLIDFEPVKIKGQ
jgi:hypothetical protein